jgi:IS30 family transposase
VHADTPSLQVSHETIYTAIYAMPRGALRTEVIGWLRFGHAKRRPRARGEDRRGRIPDMVSIHDRPPEIEDRLIPGHWEGDLIKGAQNRSAIGTLVERTPLFTVLSRMNDARAESALSGFSHVLNRIEAQGRLSLTYDQGREMAAHHRRTDATGGTVYFADPHSPWQRGINENPNGLLRQDLPQGRDLRGVTQKRAGCDCLETEYPTTQVAGLQVSRGVVYPGRVRFQAASCCAFCPWSLKPPPLSRQSSESNAAAYL